METSIDSTTNQQAYADALARAKAYRKALLAKIDTNEEELSKREKRFLLRTGSLPFKAITYPESLTPAERNRLRFMPPPDEVAATIQRVTNGAMSTPEELYQKAIDDAESLPLAELQLITFDFDIPATVYDAGTRNPWLSKLGPERMAAYLRITTDLEKRARWRATAVMEMPERVAEMKTWELGFQAPRIPEDKTQLTAWLQRIEQLRARAAEKQRLLDEYDEKLFAEARESMSRMADELEGEVCHCESCSAFALENGQVNLLIEVDMHT